jgi:membrane fusion protein (multidrug efflux system)
VKIKIIIWVLAITLMLIISSIWWLRASGVQTTNSPSAQASGMRGGSIPVRLLELSPQPFVREYRFNGTIEAREHVMIRTELAGRVAAIHFEDGDSVKAGDILLELDDREWVAQLKAAREELKLAKSNALRQQLLFVNNVTTERARDEAVSRQAVLEAEVERLTIRLEKAKIVAPFDGLLGFREISLGALLEPASRITSLTTVNPLLVDFIVPEALLDFIAKGAEIDVAIAGEAGPETARIQIWEPSIDRTTRTLRVRAVMDNPQGSILPGAFVRVTIKSINSDAMVIPAEALIRGLADVAVYVVEEGKAQRRIVRVGSRDGENVEILEGLNAGDRLIFRGMQRARAGVDVEIIEERKQAPYSINR